MAFIRREPRTPIDEHPDLVALRDSYDRAAYAPRSQMLETMALLTGLYIAASPWITGYYHLTTLAVTTLIAGIAYTVLLGRPGAYERTHAMAWTAAMLGLWTAISPWCVAGNVAHTRSITSNVIAGVLAMLLALALAAAAAQAESMNTMRHSPAPGTAPRTSPGPTPGTGPMTG
jgi:hypothetical protein